MSPASSNSARSRSGEVMVLVVKALRPLAMTRSTTSGGTVAGQRGAHVLLAPPFIATRAELDDVAGRLAEAIDAAVGSLDGS